MESDKGGIVGVIVVSSYSVVWAENLQWGGAVCVVVCEEDGRG